MDDNLKKKTKTALFWSFADKFGQQLLYLVSGVLLARMLSSAEYGMMGELAIFIALSGILLDSGFSSALIRKKDSTDTDYSTIFFLNVAISVTLYLILFFCSPVIAEFFGHTKQTGQADFTRVCQVLFTAILFNALALIQQTRAFKLLQFTTIARVNNLSLALSSAIAIGLAYYGFGIWALVAQTVGLSLFRAILFWFYSSWRPRLEFRVSVIREFFGYSSNLFVSGILNNLFNKIYPPIIGKVYGLDSAGFYAQADKYQEMASSLIGNIFRSVGFPVLSSVHQDRERLIRVFRKYIRTMSFFIFPVMMLMMIVSEPMFVILIKEKWLPAVPLFRLLCISGMFAPFIVLYYDLFNSIGRSQLNLQIEIGKKIYLLAGICLLYSQSVLSLTYLWISYTLLSLVVSVLFAHRLIRYSARLFIADILPYFCIALCTGVVSVVAYRYLDGNATRFFAVSAIYMTVYLFSCFLFKRETLDEIWQMVQASRHKPQK